MPCDIIETGNDSWRFKSRADDHTLPSEPVAQGGQNWTLIEGQIWKLFDKLYPRVGFIVTNLTRPAKKKPLLHS